MEDIRLALGLMCFVSAGLFLAGIRVLRKAPHVVTDGVGVTVIGLLIAYLYAVWGQLWIVRWIPLPSVIVLSNWFAPILALLGAVVWARLSEFPVRRTVTAAALVGGGLYSLFFFIPGNAPECGNEWFPASPTFPYPICHQTTPRTCSAAAAATVLSRIEIMADEQEMAKLCLTADGTTWLGLYHGLMTKLMGNPWTVEFVECEPESLAGQLAGAPGILCCRLAADTPVALRERYLNAGWRPGTAHSVVVFGSLEDHFIMGDPSVGPEIWHEEELNYLWTGEALVLRLRPGFLPEAGH